MRKQAFAKIFFGFYLLACSACGGTLYKVAPLPVPAPSIDDADGFKIGATAFEGVASLNQFEANLPLAGVIAVDVRMANRTDDAVSSGKFKFELNDAKGKSLKWLEPKKALKAVMKYYENTVYAKAAYRQALEDYRAISLKLDGAIQPQEERRGVLFFQTNREAEELGGLTLLLKDKSKGAGLAPITVKVETR